MSSLPSPSTPKAIVVANDKDHRFFVARILEASDVITSGKSVVVRLMRDDAFYWNVELRSRKAENSGGVSDERELVDFYLEVANDSKKWHIDADITFGLFSCDEDEVVVYFKETVRFTRSDAGIVVATFDPVALLEKHKALVWNEVVIGCSVVVNSYDRGSSIGPMDMMDRGKPFSYCAQSECKAQDGRNAAIMTEDGGIVYANRDFLCTHSTYFKTVFYGGWDAIYFQKPTRVPFTTEMFVELLNVLVFRVRICDRNVLDLLRMADFLRMETLMSWCETILHDSDGFSHAEKRTAAIHFGLQFLANHHE